MFFAAFLNRALFVNVALKSKKELRAHGNFNGTRYIQTKAVQNAPIVVQFALKISALTWIGAGRKVILLGVHQINAQQLHIEVICFCKIYLLPFFTALGFLLIVTGKIIGDVAKMLQ